MLTTHLNMNSLSGITKSIALLLLLVGLSFPQDKSIDYFEWRVLSEAEVNSDKIALVTVIPAYLARCYDRYLPWWQADLLAFTSTALWEVKDGLIPIEKEEFLGGKGFSALDLKYGAIGIVANRVLPVIVKTGLNLFKSPAKRNFDISFKPKSYPKLTLSFNL